MFLGAGTLERQGNVSVPCTSYVGPPVWYTDLASGGSRDQETEDVSNVVPAGHPWTHTMGQAKKCSRLEAGRGSARGEAVEPKTTAMARSCAADAWPLHPEATPQTTREEKKAGGTSLPWIGVVSRDLVGVPNWQETVKDMKAWRAVIHQTGT